MREIVRPRLARLGPLPVRRALPSVDRMMVGPFILMDHGGPTSIDRQQAHGVGEHPHAGLATLTYLLADALIHRDSAGNSARIEVGDLALMTAGGGITHEERPDQEHPSPVHTANFIQMWIALPERFEDMAPDFEIHRAADLPSAELPGARVTTLIGSAWGLRAPTTTYSETVLADLVCAPDSVVPIEAHAEERAIYLLEGEARLDGRSLEPQTLVILEGEGVELIDTEGGCRLIVLGGARFASPPAISGSFVGSSVIKVAAFQEAYRSGQFPKMS